MGLGEMGQNLSIIHHENATRRDIFIQSFMIYLLI